MTLPLETRRFIATGYEAALRLEELQAQMMEPNKPHPTFPGMAVIDDAVRAVATEDAEWRGQAIHAAFDEWRPQKRAGIHAFEWMRNADISLNFLRRHVPRAVGSKLRDRLDAVLILMAVRERVRPGKRVPVEECAAWVSLDPVRLIEAANSKALRDLVSLEPDTSGGTISLTVDGELAADALLEPVDDAAATVEQVVAGAPRVDGVLERLEVRNLLSFGPDAEPIELGKLNVLIGPNGSGKSNVLDLIMLLASTPRDVQAAVRAEGGIHNLLWLGGPRNGRVGAIDAVVGFPHRPSPLRHTLRMTVEDDRFRVADERVENASADGYDKPFFFFAHEARGAMLSVRDDARTRHLEPIQVGPERSILSERRDPARFPELSDLAGFYEGIRAFREPLMGKRTAARAPQQVDARNDGLLEDGSNLALVLNRIRLEPAAKRAIVERLQAIYASVRDVDVKVEGGTVQLFLEDEGFSLPVTRFSDGTLRFLALLVLLHQPSPPPLILIDEVELGLHPDAVVAVAELLEEISTRSQVIVTTHSVALVDRFSETPEVVHVVDREEASTRVRRLVRDDLKEWLAEYSLGRLWRMGELGGNRW